MENNTTLIWVVLAVSACGYVSTSAVLASILSVRRERLKWLIGQDRLAATVLEGLYSTPMGPGGSLSLLRALFFTTAALSGFLIVAAWTESYLRWIAWTSIGFVSVMTINHLASRILAALIGELIALKISAVVRTLAFLLWPVLVVEDLMVRRVKSTGIGLKGKLDEPMPAELGISVETSGERLDEREVMMIKGVVQLDKTTAREIMVPRMDMAVAEISTSLDQMAVQMVDSGHSRIPIYSGNLDQVEGIAYARDVLSSLSQETGMQRVSIAEVMRSVLFIPEPKTLEEVLKEFQEKHINIAIVVDEYGGVSGMVTMEDLLEEIVGEIQDEFEVAGSEIQLISEDEFLIDARVSLDDLNELFKLSVEGDGFDTVGGLVYHELGKIPSSGDSVVYDGLKIEVISTVGRRLKKLRVVRFV